MIGDNATGKLLYVLGLLVLAATTFFFFSQSKVIWLLLYLVLGLACITEKRALFVFFLANVVVALSLALKRGILDDQTLSIFLVALLSALAFVATGAKLGRSSDERQRARTKKEVTKKIGKQLRADKKQKVAGRKKATRRSARKTSSKRVKKARRRARK